MQYAIGFGLGFDKAGKAIDAVQRAEALKIILTDAVLVFGGGNITFGQGAWINHAGDLVVEESAVLTVQAIADGRLASDFHEDAKLLAERVRQVLDQEAVILTVSVATSRLLTV